MIPLNTEKLELMRQNDPDLKEKSKGHKSSATDEEVKFSWNLVKIIERWNEGCP